MSNNWKNQWEYNLEELEKITYWSWEAKLSFAENETQVKLNSVLPTLEENYDDMLNILNNFHTIKNNDELKNLIFCNEKLREKWKIDDKRYNTINEKIRKIAEDNNIKE
jgi:hypothetical protein